VSATPRLLIITNGRSAVAALDHAGIPGEKVPWEDILHDGPVPGGLDLQALSKVRAQFLASCGWGAEHEILADLRRRDARLEASIADEVVLWFEHDLYDQLQLLQLLDWYAAAPTRPDRLALICRPAYVSQERVEDLSRAFASRAQVTRPQLELARRAWAAFRAPQPTGLASLFSGDTRSLPFLRDALGRLLEEYPAADSGLSRTQRQILEILKETGTAIPRAELFERNQLREKPVYLGDASFFQYVDALGRAPESLLEEVPDGVRPLEAGARALTRSGDWVGIPGGERWIGGTCLRPGNVWCRDRTTGALSRKREW
jgi:hypothetical protein